MKKALYSGSFDPYTIGHDAILKRALKLFDTITIGIGVNIDKNCLTTNEQRKREIAEIYHDEPRISIETYSGLTAFFAKKIGADFLIRGARNSIDFENEREIAEINRKIAGIDTIIFIAEAQYTSINSHNLRELLRFGQDISPFLPTKKNNDNI